MPRWVWTVLLAVAGFVIVVLVLAGIVLGLIFLFDWGMSKYASGFSGF